MPELPEVEITKLGLWSELSHQPILEKIIYHRKDLRWTLPEQARKKAPGQRLINLRRRGKYLIFEFQESVLVSHLGMSGSWRKVSMTEPLKKHDHIEFIFGGSLRFIYNDPRRFGFLEFLKSQDDEKKYFKELGVEPLDSQWLTVDLFQKLKTQKRALKVALMDQKNIVGVGNIYANEALFIARLSPFMSTSVLRVESVQRLRSAVESVLRKSLKQGGSTIQDFLHTNGAKGAYQQSFLVYDRDGESCSSCKALIKFKNFSGRATYWCPVCQKKSL